MKKRKKSGPARTPLFDKSQKAVRDRFDYHLDGYLVALTDCGSNKTTGRVLGHISQYGYHMTRINKKHFSTHRLIWLWHYGSYPTTDIDHIDGDRLNNRITNLRLASRSQNNLNARKRSGTSSKWKGVSFAKNTGRWRAYINVSGRPRIALGYFNNEEDAAQAYNFAAALYAGEFAKYNKVIEDDHGF